MSNLLPMNDVRPAQQAVAQLRAENEQLRNQFFHTCSFLCALLKDKHDGRAFVDVKTVQSMNGWAFSFYPQPELGTFRLSLVLPGGTPYTPVIDGETVPEAPPPTVTPALAASSEPAPVPEPESAPCDARWHSDVDRTGRFCPCCGNGTTTDLTGLDGPGRGGELLRKG